MADQQPLSDEETKRLAEAIEDERQAGENSWPFIFGQRFVSILAVVLVWGALWVFSIFSGWFELW